MVKIFHLVCRGVAFRYDHLPTPDEMICAQHAVLADGSRPVPHTPIVCESCGQEMTLGDLFVPAERDWAN